MEIRSVTPHLILIGLFVLTALALAFTVDVELNDQPGVRMELPPALDNGWVGDQLRYSHNPDDPKQYRVSKLIVPDVDPDTGEKLYTMSLAEYDALPKDTQFIKSIYTNAANEDVFVSIVLSGRERDSIHRPQRCLVGQGYTIVATKTAEIPLEGRKPLKVAVLETVRNYTTAEGERKAHLSYYAYWFVGQNRETHSHSIRMFWLAWDRIIHSVAHKWAYIAVAGERLDETDSYQAGIAAFVKDLYPHLLVRSSEPQNTELQNTEPQDG